MKKCEICGKPCNKMAKHGRKTIYVCNACKKMVNEVQKIYNKRR